MKPAPTQGQLPLWNDPCLTATQPPTHTPVPTYTPFLTPTFVPTPPAYSVDPGDIEQSVNNLYDCIRSDEEFKEVFKDMFLYGASLEPEMSGFQPETAGSFFDFVITDRDIFVSSILESIDADPELEAYMAMLGEDLSDICRTESPAPETEDTPR